MQNRPWRGGTAAILIAAGIAVAAFGQRVEAVNEIEPWQQVGQQPYELTWVQRQQDPRTLVDFEDLKGWTLELLDGARGELRRSREQQLWGQYVAKFQYAGTGPQSRVIARPPTPVAIPGEFDSVDLWGYGNRWNYEEDKSTPSADIAVWIRDARGHEFRIEMTNIRWKQWWLIHRKIPAQTLKQIVLPASVSGIEVAKAANTDLRYFFCDSLAVYREELAPLELKKQPRRNLAPWRGQNAGLNTGEGRLPFPTREQTILPANFEKNFRTGVKELPGGAFELRYEGKDAAVVYTYRPRLGRFDEVEATVGTGKPFRPMAGGGIRFEDTARDAAAEGSLVSARIAGDTIQARFRFGIREVEYELRLWQKSLLLDVLCGGGEATEVRFGTMSGVEAPQLITVPYLTYGRTNPRVLMAAAGGKPVFASVWFDWYRTNASEAYAPREPKVTRDSAEVNGGLRYLVKTDGMRNTLYERLFLTVSPNYEEVLPTIANPPAPRGKEAAEVLWTYTFPYDFAADHERSRFIRSYGLDKVMQHTHEITWRDEGDSNTLRLRAAPQKGGDAKLQWYVEAQKKMGWRQGVYTNYTDFCPVNTNWNPDHVIRQSDGDWKRSWPRNYKLKPSKAVEFEEFYAPRLAEKFGVNMTYTDVHTSVAPWDHCDFDARVPGAGTMAATFYAYGQLLLNDQRVFGPTLSEGTYQWMYAGLSAGNPGFAYTADINLLTHPLDVAFSLHKLHPLECDYGLGPTFFYFDRGFDPQWRTSPKRREYLDLFLATTIAYGNTGWLVTEFDPKTPFGVEAMVRSYYMMQQLQQQYALAKPAKIEFADEQGRLFTVSDAMANGVLEQGRLHIAYENGTEVYVHRGKAGRWLVKDQSGQVVELPPLGWMAYNRANGFREVSGNVSGRRVDSVISEGYEYLDGRGEWAERGALGCAGGVALRKRGGDWEVLDLYGNQRVELNAPPGGTLTSFDADGNSLGKVETSSPRPGWVEFRTKPGARKYLYAK